jgi:tape measure domain-containing protein
MGTIDTLLRVKADATQAVRGLKPLQTSLEETAKDAQHTEQALNDLDGQHKISLNDQAIESARKEVERLRTLMREQLRLDPTADTREAQRRISQLQRSIKTLDDQHPVVDVEVDADATGLVALRTALGSAATGLTQGAGGGLVGGLSAARAGMAGLGAETAAAGVAVGGIAVGFGAAAKQAWDLGEAAADVQTSVVQLNALTSGLGVETFQELNKWASETPFALDDATEATKRLVAAGVPLSDIPDYLNQIGNVAAATGVPISQLGAVFAQMEASGKASYENLQQIAESGVPVWQTLSEKIGLSVEDLQKLASEGKLTKDSIELLRLSLNDLYPDAMQQQAATFNGQMSTLKDTMATTSATAGTLFLPVMQDTVATLQNMANWVATGVGKLTELDQKLRDASDSGDGLVETLGRQLPGGAAVLDLMADGQKKAAEETKKHKSEADALAASILAESDALKAAEQSLSDHAPIWTAWTRRWRTLLTISETWWTNSTPSMTPPLPLGTMCMPTRGPLMTWLSP